MTKLQLFISSVLILLVIALSCNPVNNDAASEDTSSLKSLNPNGDSELAILMRQMFDDGLRMKAQILHGEQPVPSIDFDKVLTAHATEPEKAASPEYQSFAAVYMQTVEALYAHPDADAAVRLYDNMVTTCINCHQALCPGPVARIKKLQGKEVNPADFYYPTQQ